MKKVAVGLSILSTFSVLANYDKVIVTAGQQSCVLNHNDSISTKIKGTKYSVDFKRRADLLTVRVGEILTGGSSSTFIYMDEIPVPTQKISFRAGDLMAQGFNKSISVGIYNLTNANAMTQDLFIDAEDCINNFAN